MAFKFHQWNVEPIAMSERLPVQVLTLTITNSFALTNKEIQTEKTIIYKIMNSKTHDCTIIKQEIENLGVSSSQISQICHHNVHSYRNPNIHRYYW